ncbi:MAG: OadG family protein [Desulfobulbaceae bacterium]|nr:OadG family protein [Desulfobulbaceae bacterium]
MEFSFNHCGFSNLFVGDFNAVTFSLFGMGLVFCGLVIISLYVMFLPKLIAFMEKKPVSAPSVKEEESLDAQVLEKELLLAIATAYYLDQNFPEENQKITWKSHGDVDSPWQISGRVQGMSQRTHVSRRFFPRR